jgi:hypothetical protein
MEQDEWRAIPGASIGDAKSVDLDRVHGDLQPGSTAHFRTDVLVRAKRGL